MKKKIFSGAVIAFAFFCLAAPIYADTPWLHTEGNKIKDPNENVVVLRGLGIIDLGTIELYDEGVINVIDRVTNKSDSSGNSPGWYTKVIRLVIYPADAPDYTSPFTFDPNDSTNTYYDYLLRPVVDYCKTKDLYVIIDWHYIANTYDHVDSTSQFWAYMASRFANDSHVIFELFNEPINDLNGDWIFNSHDTADWLSVRTNMQTWINIVRTYAPNNLILVAGSNYSQIIAPAAAYPVTGDNIAIVSHIYPVNWRDSHWGPSYKAQVDTALTRYPVFASEWGFCNDPSYDTSANLRSTISEYGQPLMDFLEIRDISSVAWDASRWWGTPMFNPDWTLRVNGGYGGFVKDMLYAKRFSDQPEGGDTIAPAAPTGLATTVAGITVSLNWNDNSESDLYGYHIYRSTTSGGPYTKLNTLLLRNTSYTDYNTVNYTTYYYVAKAVDTSFNSSGYSSEIFAYTTIDTTPPAAPTGLTARPGSGANSLDWNDNSEFDLAGYNVYRSTTSGGPYTKINVSLVSSSNYIDPNATNLITYYYVVKAVDTASNESSNSNEASAMATDATPPARPTGLTATAAGSTVLLDWDDNNEPDLYGYNVYRAVCMGCSSNKLNTSVITSSSYTDSSVTIGTTYYYVVRAVDYSSNISGNSDEASSIILPDTTPPAAPTGLTATAGSGTVSLELDWNDNIEPDLAGYNVYRGITSGGPYSILNGSMLLTSSNYIDTTATVGTTYYYVIKARDLVGNLSDNSNQASATYVDTTPPAAPAGLAATAGISTVSLDWNNNTEIDLDGYNVYRSITSGSDYVKLNSSLLSSSDYNDTNASAGTTYYYVVTAADTGDLESDYSGEVSATPNNPAGGTGSVLREWWTGIPGDDVDYSLLANVNYPDNPSGRQLITKLEGPTNWNDNYGIRIRGYLNPVTSGNYNFWIASANTSYLFLSADDNPDNLTWTASVDTGEYIDPCQWNKYPSQAISSVPLEAGQKYYFIVLHKAGIGNDNLSVAWEGPAITQQVIDGIYLSPCSLKFVDFAGLADNWNRTDCGIGNNWCNGNDFNRDGTVGIDDLAAFVDGWLIGDYNW